MAASFDSCPSDEVVAGLFFEFGADRTASSDRGTAAMPSSRSTRAGLANSVRKECKAAGIVDTSANLWKFYVNKCRNNLHLVLAMSPSGDKLRLRCRSFPGLISNCVIDWFFAWC